MQPHFSGHFIRSYVHAPSNIQRVFDQKLRFLLVDLRHPSIRAKKYDEGKGTWQGRVTRDWRFYFTIKGDTYVFLDIRKHPK